MLTVDWVSGLGKERKFEDDPLLLASFQDQPKNSGKDYTRCSRRKTCDRADEAL